MFIKILRPLLKLHHATNHTLLIPGSPYKFHVDSISSGYVTAYGPGLLNGVSGEPSEFTISTKGAGSGGLSMAVEGPSKAEVRICFFNRVILEQSGVFKLLIYVNHATRNVLIFEVKTSLSALLTFL